MLQLPSVRHLRLASILLTAISGCSILAAYLSYLNSTLSPLAPNPDDSNWPYIKAMIFFWWLLVLFSCLKAIKKQLFIKGCRVKPAVMLRSLVAGVVFAVCVTGYHPPGLEMSDYFFINTFAYALLIYAFFSIVYVERCSVMVGKYVLRLLRLPSVYWIAPAFMCVFVIAYHLSWVLFQHFPWLHDTIAQLVHAKFIAQGHLYGQSPPLNQFFQMVWMVNDGKWYSQYPPGHVFMLAIGTALHHVEMVNPFLGACTCIAAWLLAKELYGAHVAKIAVFLAGLCTYIIMISSEYMNNATSLLTGTLFLWAYFRVLNQRGWPYALAAGAALGYCFLTRPYTAFALSIPSALYALYLVLAKSRVYLRPMAIIAVIFACFIAFQLYFNAITTGNPLEYGYQKIQGDWHNPFTHAAAQRLTPEQLYKNIRINIQRLSHFNRILFEWPLPSMALVAFLFAIRGNRRDERLLFLTILSMLISVQFVTNTDFILGPRLVCEISGILLVFCAKALSILPPLLRKTSQRCHSLSYYYGVGILIMASFYFFAFQYNLKTSTLWTRYYINDREGNPQFYNNIVKQANPPALIFVPPYTYKFVSFTNPPNVTNPFIFAIDLGEQDKQLMSQFSQRNIYRVAPNAGGFSVVKIR